MPRSEAERLRLDATLTELDCIGAALATPGYLGEAERVRLAGRLHAAREALATDDPMSQETPMRTYLLAPDAQAITCLDCGATSWNALDVQQRYCGQCQRFHDDAPRPPLPTLTLPSGEACGCGGAALVDLNGRPVCLRCFEAALRGLRGALDRAIAHANRQHRQK